MRPVGRRRALVILALACMIWGTGFPLTRALVLALQERGSDAVGFAAAAPVVVRFAFAAVVFLLVLRFRIREFCRDEVGQGALLGALAAITTALHVAASRVADATIVAFLSQLYCVLVVLGAAVIARVWPSRRVWLCVGLVMLGAFVLSGLRLDRLSIGAGEVLTLLSTVTIAAQIHVLGVPRYRNNNATRVSFVMCLAAALFLLPALLGPGSQVALKCVSDPDLLLLNLIFGVVITGLLFWLMNQFQPEVDPVEAGLIYMTEPLYAALGAAVLPPLLSRWLAVDYVAEPLTLRLAVGGGLIVAANAALQWRSGERLALGTAEP